jgi:hypothetical protein
MRDQLAIEVNNSEKDATFLTVNSMTPAQELFEIGQGIFGADGFTEMVKYGMAGTNPLVRNLFELAFGREMFTGFEIGKPEEGAAVTYPKWLLKQTGAIYELSTKVPEAFIGVKGDGEVDIAGGVMRSIIGGRLQKREVDSLIKSRRFESGESATRLRFAIRRAVKDGDEEEARRLALRYTEMHRQLWDIGLIDLVPKALRRLFRQQDYQRRQAERAGV